LARLELITMTQKYNDIELTAAGGWVENGEGQVLWIHRLGQWDLPKGKWEPNESIEECAMREVEEECGVAGLTLGKKLIETTHFYVLKGQHVKKITHWYRMSVKGVPALTPQSEEGIDRVDWLDQAQWQACLAGTYDSIKSVANQAMRTESGTKTL
jgi:8-oxo-dGTP pyrophosphatase MutT (NUDIX family)